MTINESMGRIVDKLISRYRSSLDVLKEKGVIVDDKVKDLADIEKEYELLKTPPLGDPYFGTVILDANIDVGDYIISQEKEANVSDSKSSVSVRGKRRKPSKRIDDSPASEQQ